MNPAVFILAGAGFIALAGKKKRRSASISCPPLNPNGGHAAGFDYIEFTTGGANLNEKLPLIVFFHSLSANPGKLSEHIKVINSKARVVMPSGHFGTSSYPKWWELRAATEHQSELAEQMSYAAKQISPFVKLISSCRPTVGRPIITGHSQGGMMTMAVAAESPSSFRAAIPVSGWLPRDLWPKSLPETIAIHGTGDRTVDFDRTADFISRANGAGLPIELIPIDSHKHGLSGDMKSTWLDAIDWSISNL